MFYGLYRIKIPKDFNGCITNSGPGPKNGHSHLHRKGNHNPVLG